MLAKVVGERVLDFTTNDNKQIKGTKIFVLYKSENQSDSGEVADSIFIKDGSKLGHPAFEYGKEYNFEYTCAGLGGRAVLNSIKNKDGSIVKQKALSEDGEFPFN